MEAKFEEGIWVGVSGTSQENNIVLTRHGPRVARTVKRMEDTAKYDLDFLNNVVGKPFAREDDEEEAMDSEIGKPIRCQAREDQDEEIPEDEKD